MNPEIYPEGTIIDGRYRIVRRLGRGGFATVYQAEHLQLGRAAALKVLEPVAPHVTARFQARFNTEARIAANLDHPNVVRIFDFGFIEGDDRPYMAMELLEGTDLDEYLRGAGSMDPARARALFLPILDALRVGHERGIVHKDLKPANLFFLKAGTPDEKLIVLDYGIARLEGDANPNHTEEGTYTGTPAYMPPEYIQRREVTSAYDVYQLGLIFIEAMTGQPVVVAGSPLAYLVAHIEGKHRIPEGFGDTALGATLLKAIAIEPANRYANAGEFFDAVSIAEVRAGTDFTLAAITVDEAGAEQIAAARRTTERPAPLNKPKSGLPIALILGALLLVGLVGCSSIALLVGAYFMVDDDFDEFDDPAIYMPSEPIALDPPEFPTMPNIANYPSEGQEMQAWLLARYMILTTLNQVRLYDDLLAKTGGWTAKGAAFVPSGTNDLMGLGRQQLQFGLDNAPRREPLEGTARALMSDLNALQQILSDLYDYHSVMRGWESDAGAHGKQLTGQLHGIAQRFEPAFAKFSTHVDQELIKHLAQREDLFATNPFLQLATRAMVAEATLIRTMAEGVGTPKSNAALSKFDGSLQALEKHMRSHQAALTEQYMPTMGIHDRFLGSLKDTRRQAVEIRTGAEGGDDTRADVIFMWMQLHMTFDVYNQLQRF